MTCFSTFSGVNTRPSISLRHLGVRYPSTTSRGIYEAMVGDRYYVRPRGWWNHFWRVALLTTEAVPTRIIETIDREAADRGVLQDDRFKVYEFDLPESSRDTVTIELQLACKKKTQAKLVRAYRVHYPEAEVISDMVKNCISEFGVTTHMSAKGSNAYIGSDILAFYNALSPALFGELGALNARFGRSDLVRLFYLDRFEQTSGRNRGFRGERGRDHRAIFPPRLYGWLAPALSGASYVGVLAKPTVTIATEIEESDKTEELDRHVLSSADAALLGNAGVAPSEGLQQRSDLRSDLCFAQSGWNVGEGVEFTPR